MSDGLRTEVQLRLEVISNLRKGITDLADFELQEGRVEGKTKSLKSELQKLHDKFDETGRGAKSAGQSLEEAADKSSQAWKDLRKELKEASEEYRAFRRDQITGEDGPGKDVSAYSLDELREYIALQDAANANFISEARKRVQIADQAAEKQLADTAALKAAEEALMQKRINDSYALERRNKERLDAERAAMQAAQGGRDYSNLSVNIDAGIAARQKEAVAWSTQLKGRLEDQAQAQAAANRETEQASKVTATYSNESLPRLRYALYDVATTANIASAAIIATGTAAAVAAASYESAFTNVERTLEPGSAAIEEIREELIQLSNQIPVSFSDLSAIATLGNQLGIAGQDVTAFTETVARFSAVTGVSAEEASKAFGAMQYSLKVPASEFENLGAAIALVGRSSVATEPEILSLTKEIGTQANQAGFAASEVIALAGTLGQLRVPPERARGSLTTYFQTLNQAVAEGGDALRNFATVTGMSMEGLDQAVRSGRGVEVFERFINGLQSDDVVEVTEALDELGLSQLRVSDVFQRLSTNSRVFTEFLAIGEQGYTEGTELARQYAMVVDDLASRWQVFVNHLSTFAATVGSVIAPAIGTVLDTLSELLAGLTEFAQTPFGTAVIQFAAGLGGLAAVLLGVVGTAALAGASMAALKTAIEGVTAVARAGGLMSYIASLFAAKSAADGATASVITLRGAIATLARATGVLAILGLLIGVVTDLRGSVQSYIDIASTMYDIFGKWAVGARTLYGVLSGVFAVLNAVGGTTYSVGEAITAVIRPFLLAGDAAANAVKGVIAWGKGVLGTVSAVASALGAPLQRIVLMFRAAAMAIGKIFAPVGEMLGTFGDGFVNGLDEFDGAVQGAFSTLRDLSENLPSMKDWDEDIQASTGSMDDWLNAINNGAGGADNLGDSVAGAAKEVRTLADYAGDLGGVMSRAFDIRWGSQQGLDSISSGWLKVADSVAEARRSIEEYQAKLAGLNSDKSTLQYWLTIAEMYGDEKRAEAIRAELASVNSDLAKTQSDLAKAQDAASMSLTGNSESAIQNRATILGMIGDYQGYIQALSSSGMSQEDLKTKSQQLKDEFIQQAIEAGYSRDEVLKYASSFDDMRTAIAGVPRNVTVAFNPDPALQALAEFAAKAAAAGRKAGEDFGNGFGDGLNKTDPTVKVKINPIGFSDGRSGGKVQAFDTGGYTGAGGKYDVAGVVHKDEFVFSKEATSYFGPGFLNRMHEAGKSGKGMAPAGIGAGTGFTELGPASINALAQALYVRMEMNGQVVAEGVSSQFATSNRFGGN